MSSLILKLGATGDVVRTTALLRKLEGPVTWVTAQPNHLLLQGIPELGNLRVVLRDDFNLIRGETFDLIVNLEDDEKTASLLKLVQSRALFGATLGEDGRMTYTDASRRWFEMSLISAYGRKKADELKYLNRTSYQELVFEGLGWKFCGEKYFLPETAASDLRGDVAIASEAGAVWPMKKWAHYDRLADDLQKRGLTVNFLPKRPTLLEHLADVRGHRCLISGDSLPMHLAIGSEIPCVAVFNCTSPWEIYDYGLLTKVVSPRLGEFFYSREFDAEATNAVSFDVVLSATLGALRK